MKHKAPQDPRGGHVRLYWSLLDSNAWRSLTPAYQRAYIALRRQLTSFNNGDLSLPITYARHHGISNESTLARSLRALGAVGLIAITARSAHRPDGSRLPNLYRFTDEITHAQPRKFIEAQPATNEWRNVPSIAAGKALIREAERKAAEEWEAEDQRRKARKAARAGAAN